MKVLKFGGTSVGSAEKMKDVLTIIRPERPVIVVLSAMSGTTDALLEISRALQKEEKIRATGLIEILQDKYLGVVQDFHFTKELSEEAVDLVKSHFVFLKSFTLDMFTINEEKEILAQGELLTTALFRLLCVENGLQPALLPALEFMRIDENGEPDFGYIKHHLNEELIKYGETSLFITQGYICRNAFGEIDNLKRGGSDYSATLIGAAVQAEEIQIWTDIDGLHNNDPRFVGGTYPIHELSFEEAAELAYFGAKILHPTCILPAKNAGIPVKLMNTMNPEAEGTVISNRFLPEEPVKAIAAKDGIIAINIRSDRMLMAYGFLRAVFEVFERYRTPIDTITTSEVAVSLTIDESKNLESIINELKEFGTVTVEENLSIVCIVGNLTYNLQGIASNVFESLRDIPVRMISYGGSQYNISILVKTELKARALNLLNGGLFS